MNNISIGKKGEDLARSFLKKQGHVIVDHNFRCRFGEIDLITTKDKGYRFIEVKYRRTLDYGAPQESVIKKKQHRIQKTALVWLRQRHLPVTCEMHFDVLAIYKNRKDNLTYEYIEDAF
jgi:putative endonuclease